MKAVLDDGMSIYLQISRSVEDDILAGSIAEDELIPSSNQFARHYSINPATAAKGINILSDEGIIYKKRGIGMCVSGGAREIILSKRKREFFEGKLPELIREAGKLGISNGELAEAINQLTINN